MSVGEETGAPFDRLRARAAAGELGARNGAAELNWSGTYRYRAREVHRPTTTDELRRIVASSERLKVVGTRHSFNDIGDPGEAGALVSLAGLSGDPQLDETRRVVRVPGGTRYGELAVFLQRHGWALGNLASLPHIDVAGAVATATHGSGNANRSLASAVTAMTLLTSTGDEVRLEDPELLAGAVVHLGALGVVTELELAIEPTYQVRQDVYLELPWEAVLEEFDAVFGAGYSVSLMTTFAGPTAGQLWVKTRLPADGELPVERFGARAATEPVHPTLGNDPRHATPQLGAPGAWCDRLPHFLLEFTPSTGSEIQTEFLFDRSLAPAVITALRGLGDRIAAAAKSAEIRTVAAEPLWLSPAYRRDSAAVHFTWNPDPMAVAALAAEIGDALAPFAVRPHWAKVFGGGVFDPGPRSWAELYPRLGDFAELVRTYDPRGAFRNDFLDRIIDPET